MRSYKVSLRNKHLGSVPTEEVPLWTEASPACLEREDHATAASDGLRHVKIDLFPSMIVPVISLPFTSTVIVGLLVSTTVGPSSGLEKNAGAGGL